MVVMQTLPQQPRPPRLAAIAFLAALTAGLVAALAGWSMFGTSILFTYAESGLAWCF
ncbi:hypothetical protein IHQ71_16055 [Rhizobium sp. TH2]|uniref:hypothetical protein n=1 Tax=Rhizobium sp. TH2 TaxID=2775403 RepID=UPI002157CB28|nr:hypothetical protein [Rhizobium sp. TH2]UVC06768.1 hypothetical protein IHQ71_16055 [Rhizobium sp. TH2]